MKPNFSRGTILFVSMIALLGCNGSAQKGYDANTPADGTTKITEASKDAIAKEYPLNMGNNPCITTMFTADPTARVYDDVLYLYPSTDIPDTGEMQFNGFCMPGYNVFSTTNFMDWKDYGQIIHQEDVEWARQDKYCMWAPCVNRRNGTYYYYFPTHKASGGFCVGVATSSNPEGPFEVQPQPIAGVNGIDPNSFIDDDGQAYLYWGGGKNKSIKGAKLKENMVEIETPAIAFETLPDNYKEAAFMFKRNDIYYLTFSCANGTSELHYATGKSPLGPFELKGKFFDKWSDCWTSHHSIVEYKGEWILFYHHNDISHKDKLRSVCADYLSFADNGDINLVTPTLRGIGTIYANREIQIDRYSDGDNTKFKSKQIGDEFPANWALTNIQDGAWVRYDRVDFSKQKYTKMQVRVASTATGTIRVKSMADDATIAYVNINSSEEGADWQIVEFPIIKAPKAIVDLCIEFATTSQGSCSVDWIKFL